MLLKDKVAIITGGSRGIGKAIAEAFLREGAKCVLVSRSQAELEQAKKDSRGQVEILQADVSQSDSGEKIASYCLSTFGKIDILVNAAGIQGPIGLFYENDRQKWEETLHVNLLGTLFLMQVVVPVMLEQKSGKIINFSGGGATGSRPRFSAYATSKTAVVRLTEVAADELKGTSIDINAISPGAVNTNMTEEIIRAGPDAGKEYESALKQKADESVSPVKATALSVFLASSHSDGLSGKLVSAIWDKWEDIPKHLNEIMSSEVYTLRRIKPEERGYNW